MKVPRLWFVILGSARSHSRGTGIPGGWCWPEFGGCVSHLIDQLLLASSPDLIRGSGNLTERVSRFWGPMPALVCLLHEHFLIRPGGCRTDFGYHWDLGSKIWIYEKSDELPIVKGFATMCLLTFCTFVFGPVKWRVLRMAPGATLSGLFISQLTL